MLKPILFEVCSSNSCIVTEAIRVPDCSLFPRSWGVSGHGTNKT